MGTRHTSHTGKTLKDIKGNKSEANEKGAYEVAQVVKALDLIPGSYVVEGEN